MFISSHSLYGRAAAFFACCFFFIACENDPEVVKNLNKKVITVEKGTNIDGYLSQEAKMKARLRAPVMLRYLTDSPYIEFPNTLHVDFYNDSLVIESRLDAKYGRYRVNENKVFLRDSVVVINIKGDTLHAMELWWDQHLQRYYTDKPVRIHSPHNQVLYGRNGMQANQDLTDIQFNTGSGKVQVPENGMPN